ncbi:MAG: hypothetical protein WC635_01930 [Bacteriovorax sp.]|jgi:hypothetical protein
MNISFSCPWIGSRYIDSVFILGPAFYSILIAFMLNHFFPSDSGLTLIHWIVFVLLIDVAHVYSSLYRTYLNPVETKKNIPILLFTPIICFLTGFILYSIDHIYFWRVLAYLAVFHFVRQQYGFMRIYSREDQSGHKNSKFFRVVDATTIYLATLYPLVYWHVNLPRNFNWFVENDFLVDVPGFLSLVVAIMYAISFLLFISKEIYSYKKSIPINLPKIIFIIGTSLSWFVGIVLYNSDLIFTVTNVVSHGIPYFALVWITGKNEIKKTPELRDSYYKYFFASYSLPLFLGLLFLLSFIEEGLWAGFVWREHLDFFQIFSHLPVLEDRTTLALVVPLLTLPQSTHYVLDGFIWKKKT